MESTEKKSYLYIFISGILWGLSGIFVKYLTGQGASSLLISCWRLIPAFFFLDSVTIARYGFKSLKIDGRTMMFCALTGLVTQALFNICYNTAIATIGMSVSAVGYERPVSFDILHAPDHKAQVVQSLAKWKRLALKRYGFFPGKGHHGESQSVRGHNLDLLLRKHIYPSVCAAVE